MTALGIPTRMDANGPPPAAAATLYVGHVMHARLRPLAHRFTYRVASLLVDLDRLAEAGRISALFSVGRFNLFAFDPRDHGPRDGSPLRDHVERLVAAAGAPRPERILLLCYPRVVGLVFNPLSVYFCLSASGRVETIVHEVSNTFGESHSYVLPVRPEDESAAGIRQAGDKAFHVSPFLSMRQRYAFRIVPPGEGVRIRILEHDDDGPTLAATFAGRSVPVGTGALLRLFLAIPFQTLKVVGGIHFEVARLWLKGAPFFRHAGAGGRAAPSPDGENGRFHPAE